MADYYFQMKSLSVGYNGRPLIHDINIGIHKGEIVTLIGPNGSGKSTILKSITRQLSLIGGTVFLDRQNIGKLTYKELSRKMSVVLTERMKPELMTCHEMVATGRYPYTGRLGILSREDEKKVEDAMIAVHAADLGCRSYNAISDGQRQRILLARAICQEPEIIILDEPTSFLDVRHKLELLSILRSMAKEKQITVIMSLHEIDLAQKISDKIICVKGETIANFGRPEEIFNEDVIRDLYEIDNGFFDPLFGSIELPSPKGEPEVFVISACGSGIPIFRRLQKENVPFAAGILYTNDVDYQLARLLAAEVVTERPFEQISDDAYDRALALMKKCKYVIDAGVPIGVCNRRMEALLKEGEKSGKLEKSQQKSSFPLTLSGELFYNSRK
ncbi:MAG: ABC transporter ATP-binding protein [Lachnospiraceae bacterium]|nr:ABC transporter ATP-binding protein [Lachnospiraceae bacterium]